MNFNYYCRVLGIAQVRTEFSGHAVNTSLYASHPLSLRMRVLTNLPGADLDVRRTPVGGTP